MNEITHLQTETLHFDRQNPRLVEFGIDEHTSDEKILKILWDAMDIRELIQSIAASGYFPHEALIVTEEGGKYIVIEGNRRLAALKVLLEPGLVQKHGWEVEQIDDEARKKLEIVPCIVSTREASWKYLGFKHVNGPAKWSSYAKAAYIAHVHNEYGVSLTQIAEQIGDRHNTVQKLYRGWMVLEEAEKNEVYHRENRWNNQLAFSHLYTGLERNGIRTFLDLKPKEDESEEPVPIKKLKELGELLTWLYGNKKEKKPPVIRSQNPDLKYLDQVLTCKEATSELRLTGDLDEAYELSRPSEAVLEEALLSAKRELKKAHSHFSTGFNNSPDLLKLAGTVANMADDLYDAMEKKIKEQEPEKKRRITEDD